MLYPKAMILQISTRLLSLAFNDKYPILAILASINWSTITNVRLIQPIVNHTCSNAKTQLVFVTESDAPNLKTTINLIKVLIIRKNCKMAAIKAEIMISKKIQKLHPIVENISSNLARIEPIRFIKISTDFLQASSEVTKGRVKIPVTKSGHPSAIGVSLIIDFAFKDIHFFEMNSPLKGYGGMMVEAVLKNLPKGWSGVVAMDWSNGFWDKMKERYENLEIL
jgi:hypothetical protein